MRLVWSRRALRDLEAQCDFIARDSPMAAARVEDRVLEACDALSDSPRSGRVGTMAGTHELAVRRTSLLVVYELGETAVESSTFGIWREGFEKGRSSDQEPGKQSRISLLRTGA